ncbi:hypothetical protein [Dongia rigui]|uniref:DUF4136 domain-containing protein n=1 Tax=Dongia rigui TaxID=940149 RepID=A0ABU5E4R0_9PROT|nr:hypothetical protein [Dongia rigui]MDY0874464.1 hypothetical protein [Dongia rigui]
MSIPSMRPFKTSRTLSALVVVAALGGLAAGAAGSAAAQETKVESSARIDAVAYQPIPPGAHLETQPESQSQMDDDAWRQLDADLTGRGYALGSDGAYVVTVATQLTSRLKSDQSVGTVNAERSDPKNAALFSTEGNTLLNPRDPLNTTDRTFRVNLTVYERASGHYIWRGTVERADAAIDPSTAMREMLPALLDHFGETASGVEVPLVE